MIFDRDIIAELAPSVPWQQAYKSIAVRVIEYFEDNPDALISSTDLGEALFPLREARGPEITIRQRVFKALAALAEHELKHYATQSTLAKQLYGKSYYPTNWHAPKDGPVELCCPHCKRPFAIKSQSALAVEDI